MVLRPLRFVRDNLSTSATKPAPTEHVIAVLNAARDSDGGLIVAWRDFMVLAVGAYEREAVFILAEFVRTRLHRAGTPAGKVECVLLVDGFVHHLADGHDGKANEATRRVVIARVLDGHCLAAPVNGCGVVGRAVVHTPEIFGRQVAGAWTVVDEEVGLAAHSACPWGC